MNAVLIFAMKLSVSGGTVSAHCLPLRSERNGFNNSVLIRTGNGIWTRFL